MLYSASYELHTTLARLDVRHILPYAVQPYSAESLPELNSAATSQLVVLGEYSHNTIFGEASLNHKQRAWHDTIHLRLQADTSAQGEYRVARQQCLELERIAGTTLANLVWSDIYGQTLHYSAYGCFPAKQAEFTMHYYATGKIAQF